MGKKPKEYVVEQQAIAPVRRKKAAWKGVLAANDAEIKEKYMEVYREEKRKVKRCIIWNKKKANE